MGLNSLHIVFGKKIENRKSLHIDKSTFVIPQRIKHNLVIVTIYVHQCSATENFFFFFFPVRLSLQRYFHFPFSLIVYSFFLRFCRFLLYYIPFPLMRNRGTLHLNPHETLSLCALTHWVFNLERRNNQVFYSFWEKVPQLRWCWKKSSFRSLKVSSKKLLENHLKKYSEK